MKSTLRKYTTVVAALLLMAVLQAAAQKTTPVKPGDNCDKISMKTGKSMFVDITRIDSSKIYYVICDSLEPEYTVMKRNVQSVMYATDKTVYTNDETYGKTNSNSFGWTSYAEQLQAAIERENKEVLASKEKSNYNNDAQVPRSQLKKVFQSSPAALKEFNKSKTFNLAGFAVLTAGSAFFIAANYMVTQKQENDYSVWWEDHIANNTTGEFDDNKYFQKKQTNAIIGLGVATVGAVLMGIGTGHYVNAVNIYNDKYSAIPAQYDLVLGSNGVGVRMRF